MKKFAVFTAILGLILLSGCAGDEYDQRINECYRGFEGISEGPDPFESLDSTVACVIGVAKEVYRENPRRALSICLDFETRGTQVLCKRQLELSRSDYVLPKEGIEKTHWFMFLQPEDFALAQKGCTESNSEMSTGYNVTTVNSQINCPDGVNSMRFTWVVFDNYFGARELYSNQHQGASDILEDEVGIGDQSFVYRENGKIFLVFQKEDYVGLVTGESLSEEDVKAYGRKMDEKIWGVI